MKCKGPMIIALAASFTLLQGVWAAKTKNGSGSLTHKRQNIFNAQTNTQNSIPSPEITFDELYHDFGDVAPDSNHTYDFVFTNTGDTLLQINDISSACDCAVPTLEGRGFAPGDGGIIHVKYTPEKKLGKVTRVLSVHSNDIKNGLVKLYLRANVVSQVDYEPKKLMLPLNKKNAGCPDIIITCSDNKPFAIKNFKSTGNCIIADYEPAVKKTRFVLHPKVDLGKLKSSLKGSITISLTHPAYDTVIIDYTSQARFELRPPAINIFGGRGEKPITKKVRLVSNYNEKFEIESVVSGGKMIKLLEQHRLDTHYVLELQIQAPDTKEKQNLFTETLSINIKGGEQVQLPCKWHLLNN